MGGHVLKAEKPKRRVILNARSPLVLNAWLLPTGPGFEPQAKQFLCKFFWFCKINMSTPRHPKCPSGPILGFVDAEAPKMKTKIIIISTP